MFSGHVPDIFILAFVGQAVWAGNTQKNPFNFSRLPQKDPKSFELTFRTTYDNSYLTMPYTNCTNLLQGFYRCLKLSKALFTADMAIQTQGYALYAFKLTNTRIEHNIKVVDIRNSEVTLELKVPTTLQKKFIVWGACYASNHIDLCANKNVILDNAP